MIDLLLKSHFVDPSSLSLKEIRQQLDTFLLAGHDTVAVTIAIGLLAIANHQEVQDRIHEELDLVFGDDQGRDVTSKDLRELDYLDCVIKEVLRLWAPGPLIARELVEDVIINGHVLPKDTDVWIYIRGLHRDPNQFENPDEFDPDRFLPANSSGRHAFSYLPFSGGPRICIASKLALIELKVALANVCRRLKLNSITKLHDVVYTIETTLKSKEPFAVEFVERT